MKGIFFYTLGCKVNQYETQAIYEQFIKYGYSEARLENADVVVINTCTVTSQSDAKSCRFIRKAIADSPKRSRVVVTGCLAERDKNRICNIDGVDLVLENKFKSVVADLIQDKLRIQDIDFDKIPALKISSFKNHTRAFLKVQDGCNHNCSYCKITLVRGNSKSRNIDDIISQARLLVSNNYKEVVLTGICLGAYGLDLKPKINIVDLVRKISQIDENFRIRLSSIEPNYITQDLLDLIISNKKICNYLHLPLQSGDNKILELMKRPYKVEKIEDIVNYARSKDPYFSFSTDVIVGFSTEDDKSINNTIGVLKKMQSIRTHIFKFSPREGTVAYNLENNASVSDREKWYQELLKTSDSMSLKFRSKFLNKKLDILIEGCNNNSKISGHSNNYIYIKVNSGAKNLDGFVKVKVNKITNKDTFGVI